MSVNMENEDMIRTDDLAYISPNERYRYKFEYLGDCVFSLISKGYLDEKSIKMQLASGDLARERLRVIYPEAKYHLIWDVSELKGGSILARHLLVSKIKSASSFGSLTIIGSNQLIRSFGLIVGTLIPGVKFFFFKTYEEAIENLEEHLNKVLYPEKNKNIFSTPDTGSYAHFISLWQQKAEFVKITDKPYKTLSFPGWQYASPDDSFQFKANVIEGNIVNIACEGFVKVQHIEISYKILEDIMDEFGFNESDNKFYTILDLKKIKMTSLAARKRLSHFEHLYHKRSFMVVIVATPVVLFLLKLIQKINLDSFFHWRSTDTFENAFRKVLDHRKGHVFTLQSAESPPAVPPLIIPSTSSGMADLIRKQHQELIDLKNYQHQQIQKIIEIMERMTWDESFVVPEIPIDSNKPFNEIYNSMYILFQDFKEIIQEKQLHTKKLTESEDKYKNLINLANDVIIVYQDDQIKFINSRITQASGYSPGEILGKSMDQFVAAEEIPRLRDYYTRRIQDEDIPGVYETIFLHRDGYRVPISISVGKISYENHPATMIIARDMTQKKKDEEELERYRNHLEEIIRKRTFQLQKEIGERKVAEESDRLKTAFLSNMSHEIRTPMNAIISFSNFLKEPGLSQKQHDEYLSYILSSGQSLLNLINDIIDISKIEARQLSVQESHCNIRNILEELYSYFEETRKSQKKDDLQIIVHIPDKDNNIALYTDPYRLKQILSNLLDNALKFTDSGTIFLNYELHSDFILFSVKDTGIGIPAEKKHLIFKRFGKIEISGRNMSGTGLGLAISRNLAILLGGDLWLDSQEEEGAHFILKLPYTENMQNLPVKAVIPIHTNNNYNWSGKTFLIAEDEDLNFKVLQISLSKTGAQIIRAKNGKEACDIILEGTPVDLVLMDIQMPVMDGYEALDLIKRAKPNLPVIAQTALALLEEQKFCIELGFNDYISKPIRLSELLSKMDTLLL